MGTLFTRSPTAKHLKQMNPMIKKNKKETCDKEKSGERK